MNKSNKENLEIRIKVLVKKIFILGLLLSIFVSTLENRGLINSFYQYMFGSMKILISGSSFGLYLFYFLGGKFESKNNKNEKLKLKNKVKTNNFLMQIGMNSDKQIFKFDFRNAPHILIAGVTGSGKSVFINSILLNMIKIKPHYLRLVLVDFKGTEFELFKDIPHLLTDDIIYEPNECVEMLEWLVDEMDSRNKKFKLAGVRDIKTYNKQSGKILSYVYFIVDEFGDLFLTFRGKERTYIENLFTRLALKSRTAGIHLFFSTQRPSKEIITPLIKSNLPTRIIFNVTNENNSKIALDEKGAENLKNQGDFIFKHNFSGTRKLRSFYYSDNEIKENVKQVIKNCNHIPKKLNLNNNIILPEKNILTVNAELNYSEKENVIIFEKQKNNYKHEETENAINLILKNQKSTISFLAKELKITNQTASKILDELEGLEIVGERNGNKQRDILIKNISEVKKLKDAN